MHPLAAAHTNGRKFPEFTRVQVQHLFFDPTDFKDVTYHHHLSRLLQTHSLLGYEKAGMKNGGCEGFYEC